MIGLGLGLWTQNVAALGGGGGGAFTPASLSPDLWLEATTATLFTDTGTTNVTTDGQAVEQWNDKSTAGRNVLQTTSTLRPLYKTDLSKPSVLFDGTDDQIASGSALTWTDGSGQHWFAISGQTASAASTREMVVINSSGGGYVADIYVNTSAHMEIQNTGGSFEEDAQGTIASNTPFVIIGTIATTQVEAFVDNVSGGATNLAGSPRTNTGVCIVGGQNTAFNGRIFGFVHGKGTLSSTDRANLQTYLAALHP